MLPKLPDTSDEYSILQTSTNAWLASRFAVQVYRSGTKFTCTSVQLGQAKCMHHEDQLNIAAWIKKRQIRIPYFGPGEKCDPCHPTLQAEHCGHFFLHYFSPSGTHTFHPEGVIVRPP